MMAVNIVFSVVFLVFLVAVVIGIYYIYKQA